MSDQSEIDTELQADIDVDLESPHFDDGESLSTLIDFTKHVIDTHFATMNWVDVKFQGLLVINAALVGVITFFVGSFEFKSPWSLLSILVSIGCLFVGFGFCLRHVVPIFDSGSGNSDNPRTVVGTAGNSREQYFERVARLNKLEILKFNCFQIAGLAIVNQRGHNNLRKSALWIVGTSALILLALVIEIANQLV